MVNVLVFHLNKFFERSLCFVSIANYSENVTTKQQIQVFNNMAFATKQAIVLQTLLYYWLTWLSFFMHTQTLNISYIGLTQ